MIKKIIDKFKNLDDKVRNIMIKGFKFSFIFCIVSVLVLLCYNFYMIPILYYSGTILFKTSCKSLEVRLSAINSSRL